MKKIIVFVTVVLVLGLWIVAGGSKVSQQKESMSAFMQDAPGQLTKKPEVDMEIGRVPVYFIANEGQMDERVAYYIAGKDKQIYFTQEGVTFVLGGNEGVEEKACERWIVKLDFVEADTDVYPRGEDETGAVISYFRGSPEEWRTGISAYTRVVYENLWPGIDLVYRGAEGCLKYEFVVHPGADPGMIRMMYRGANRVAVREKGELLVETPVGGFEDGRPEAYQEDELEEKVAVTIEYDLQEGEEGHYTYGFGVGEYDQSKTLILDPAVLIFCGYIGGSGEDYGNGIAVDSSGSAYITGNTTSTQTTFPETVGPHLIHNGDIDVFVAKVKVDGTNLVYCGYIGGSDEDHGNGIAVDSSGSAYITGHTYSTEAQNFPVTVGPDLTHNGNCDVFVAKVNSAGTGLIYCSYIGGSGYEYGYGIAVDGSGSAYVTGDTRSTQSSFPITVGPDLTHNGNSDVFITKVNSAGTGFAYCGYIGGSEIDSGAGIAVDSSGNVFITGHTYSTEAQNFPVTVGPDLSHNGGSSDAFIAKVKANGTGLLYCGYLGGSSSDFGCDICVDKSDSAYITGRTESTAATFPVTVGPDLTHNGTWDAFVAKVNSTGTGLIYCGYIGGISWEFVFGITADSFGSAYVTGHTFSNQTTFPVKVGPDLTHNGNSDAFIAKVEPTGVGLVYCGYLGGSGSDSGMDIVVCGVGTALVVGRTQSLQTSFPETVGPDLTHNGSTDAFVAKIHYCPVKNDFNGDGQGDILWRHYGTGANAVWCLSSTGVSAGLSQGNLQTLTLAQSQGPAQIYQEVWETGEVLNKDERVYQDVLEVNVPQEGIGGKVYWDIKEAGKILNKPGAKGIVGDVRELLKPRDHEAGVQAISILGTVFLTGVSNTNWRIEATLDLNGDGSVDILWRNYASGQNAVWFMNGSIIIEIIYLNTITDVLWRIEGAGDFNGDGNIDLLWRHYGNGQNALWYMSGATIIGAKYLEAITDVNWRIEATGDFNGDGHTDFVWRHYGSGQNALWYMSGSTHTGTVYLSTVTDVYWAIAGAGDFNGDGNTDLLWRHYVFGSNALWYMSGSTIIGSEALTLVGDLNWRIENH